MLSLNFLYRRPNRQPELRVMDAEIARVWFLPKPPSLLSGGGWHHLAFLTPSFYLASTNHNRLRLANIPNLGWRWRVYDYPFLFSLRLKYTRQFRYPREFRRKIAIVDPTLSREIQSETADSIF